MTLYSRRSSRNWPLTRCIMDTLEKGSGVLGRERGRTQNPIFCPGGGVAI